MIRWAVRRRRPGSRVRTVVIVVAGILALALALIAAQIGGWLRWSSLLTLVPAAVLLAAFGAGLVAMIRRGLAWLAG
jgi:uncharacterized protein (DUF983 family)